MRFKFLKLLVPCFALLISACGGGGGGSDDDSDDLDSNSEVSTALFVDAVVAGLEYRSPSHEGVTSGSGAFEFTEGETTSFSFGGIDLGSVAMTASSDIVTPLDIFDTTDTSDQRVVNLLVLLQSLDNDQNPANGISLPSFESDIELTGLDITADDFLTDFVAAAANSLLGTITLVSEADALAHFDLTLAGINATPNVVGTWIFRDTVHGDVSAYYEFLSNGTVMVEEYDDCQNNDGYWAATRQSAASNCTITDLELAWTLTDNQLEMSNDTIEDSCTIVSSSPHEITASCVFTGVGSNEFVVFQRDAMAYDNLIEEKYTEVGVGSTSYTQFTFGSDGASGGYSYFEDGVSQPSNGGVGTFTSWSGTGTSLEVVGTDNVPEAFSASYSLVRSFGGAWDHSAPDGNVTEHYVMIPDFDEANAESVIDQSIFAVYDAVSGVCKGVYAFSSTGTPVLRKDASTSSSSLICDFDNFVEPQLSDPDVFTVTYEFGAMVLEQGPEREICWPIQLENVEEGGYTFMACSDEDVSDDHNIEIWRGL